jgi:hypothetical protein
LLALFGGAVGKDTVSKRKSFKFGMSLSFIRELAGSH